jgi:hypothetical protein
MCREGSQNRCARRSFRRASAPNYPSGVLHRRVAAAMQRADFVIHTALHMKRSARGVFRRIALPSTAAQPQNTHPARAGLSMCTTFRRASEAQLRGTAHMYGKSAALCASVREMWPSASAIWSHSAEMSPARRATRRPLWKSPRAATISPRQVVTSVDEPRHSASRGGRVPRGIHRACSERKTHRWPRHYR